MALYTTCILYTCFVFLVFFYDIIKLKGSIL